AFLFFYWLGNGRNAAPSSPSPQRGEGRSAHSKLGHSSKPTIATERAPSSLARGEGRGEGCAASRQEPPPERYSTRTILYGIPASTGSPGSRLLSTRNNSRPRLRWVMRCESVSAVSPPPARTSPSLTVRTAEISEAC